MLYYYYLSDSNILFLSNFNSSFSNLPFISSSYFLDYFNFYYRFYIYNTLMSRAKYFWIEKLKYRHYYQFFDVVHRLPVDTLKVCVKLSRHFEKYFNSYFFFPFILKNYFYIDFFEYYKSSYYYSIYFNETLLFYNLKKIVVSNFVNKFFLIFLLKFSDFQILLLFIFVL